MVIHPLSPPILHEPYSTPPYTSSQSSLSRKRKRQHNTNEDLRLNQYDHKSKKQQDEVIFAPLTPTSPPSLFASININAPPATEHEVPSHGYQNNGVITNRWDISQHSKPNPNSSAITPTVPSQNILLRDLHLNSRTFQYNQDCLLRSNDQNEEMWEEEEEVVAERYSAMNKVLGSRKHMR